MPKDKVVWARSHWLNHRAFCTQTTRAEPPMIERKQRQVGALKKLHAAQRWDWTWWRTGGVCLLDSESLWHRPASHAYHGDYSRGALWEAYHWHVFTGSVGWPRVLWDLGRYIFAFRFFQTAHSFIICNSGDSSMPSLMVPCLCCFLFLAPFQLQKELGCACLSLSLVMHMEEVRKIIIPPSPVLHLLWLGLSGAAPAKENWTDIIQLWPMWEPEYGPGATGAWDESFCKGI